MTPRWFKIWMAAWVLLGLPGFVLGQGFRGHFSLLPDPPPFVYSGHIADQTIGTAVWLLVMMIVYAPVFAVPALMVWHLRYSRNKNAQD